MRKLRLQVQMSLDGFIAGPAGEMDWLVRDWDDALKQYVTGITEPVDCILLGRKLAQGFIPYWATHPQEEGAEKFNHTPKVVFTRSLTSHDWADTRLARGELAGEIQALKAQPGGDLIAYGGAAFVSALIREDLIDEYHLFINPTAIGSGLSIFSGLDPNKTLTLVRSVGFDCGIVVLNYVSQRAG